jgi:hypothetical protein
MFMYLVADCAVSARRAIDTFARSRVINFVIKTGVNWIKLPRLSKQVWPNTIVF